MRPKRRKNVFRRCALKIRTWCVGTTAEIGILDCAMLLKSGRPGRLPPIIRRFNNHQEVQYREEGSAKKGRHGGKHKNTQREKGNSKIAGNCPWALRRAQQRFEKEYRRCVLKIRMW